MMNAPADHPDSCAGCHGSGWQTGPIRQIIANGHVVRTYTSVIPCGHHWYSDDPTPDDVIGLDDYLANHHDEHLERARRRHPAARGA